MLHCEISEANLRVEVARRHADAVISYVLADKEAVEDLLREIIIDAVRSGSCSPTVEARRIITELADGALEYIVRTHPVELSKFVE